MNQHPATVLDQPRIRHIMIGKTQVEVVSHFVGKETLDDILKRRILREYEQSVSGA